MFVDKENLNVIEMGVKNYNLAEGQTPKLVDSIGGRLEYLSAMKKPSNAMTPLMLAASHGHVHVCDYLITRQNAKLCARDDDQYTALIHATRCNQGRVIQLLLDHNVNIMAEDSHGQTSAQFAAMCGYLDILKMLVEKDLSVLEFQGSNGMSLLILAVSKGQMDVVKFLLDKNVNIMVKNQLGMHATYLAAKSGNLSLLKLLVDKNEDVVNLKGYLGQTPLMAASFHGKIDVCKYLLTHTKVEVNEQDESGRTALFWAVENYNKEKNKIDVVDFLIKNGAMNLKNKFDETPLDIARKYPISNQLIIRKLEDKFHMLLTSNKAKEDLL